MADPRFPEPKRPPLNLSPEPTEPSKPGLFRRLFRTVALIAVVVTIAFLGYQSKQIGKYPWQWSKAEWDSAWSTAKQASKDAGEQFKKKLDERRAKQEADKKKKDAALAEYEKEKAAGGTTAAPGGTLPPAGQAQFDSAIVDMRDGMTLVDGIFGSGKKQDEAQADLRKAKDLLTQAKKSFEEAKAKGITPAAEKKLPEFTAQTQSYIETADSMILH